MGVRKPIRSDERRSCSVEDEMTDLLRIRRRIQNAHRPALGRAEHCRSLHTSRVHHRLRVVHPLLQCWRSCNGIGQACSPLVEDDQASERRERPIEAAQRRDLPGSLDVRYEAGAEHEIDGAVTNDLIGDMVIAAAGVAGLSFHGGSMLDHADLEAKPRT